MSLDSLLLIKLKLNFSITKSAEIRGYFEVTSVVPCIFFTEREYNAHLSAWQLDKEGHFKKMEY